MRTKVAILEDNQDLLKELKQTLNEIALVEVVAWARTSADFLTKVSQTNPDALLLDIDLGGDSMSGLDIAHRLKLPVLFVSGKTLEFNRGIEDHNINSVVPVQHITKPITEEKLRKILPKFIREIEAHAAKDFIYLDFLSTRRNKVAIESIVYLGTDKANGAESNNKQIFFTNRKPEILIDFSFSKMEDIGFKKNKFITIHKSFRVNVDKIERYCKSHELEVTVISETGKSEIKQLPVSENFRKTTPGSKV